MYISNSELNMCVHCLTRYPRISTYLYMYTQYTRQQLQHPVMWKCDRHLPFPPFPPRFGGGPDRGEAAPPVDTQHDVQVYMYHGTVALT